MVSPMKHLTLDETIRARVEAELGERVPNADDSEFEALLERLRRERPELAELLLGNLKVEGAELPLESEAKKAERRELKKRLWQRLFYSQEVTGEPSVNKRKTLFLVATGLTATLPVMLMLQNTTSAKPTAEPEPPPAIAEVTAPPPPASPPAETPLFPAVPPPQPSPAPARQQLPPPPQAAPAAPPATAPPASATLALGLSVYRHAFEPQPLNLPRGQQPSEPTPELALFQTSPAAAATATPAPGPEALAPPAALAERPALAHAPEGERGLGDAAPLTVQAAAEWGVPAAESSPLAWPAGHPDQGATTAAGATQAPLSLNLASDTEGAGEASGRAAFEAPAETAWPDETWHPDAARAPGAAQPDARAHPAQASARPLLGLAPGVRLNARLTTGIVVAEGGSSPVAAKTPAGGDWCASAPCPGVTWLGSASAAQPGRVQVSFDLAVVEGSAAEISAIAIDAQSVPGLAAGVSDHPPTVAQDLLRTAAGGVSDYVQALVDRQRVTTVEGRTVIEDAAPPSIGHFLLGRAAALFDLPPGQTTLVRVMNVPAGTEFGVLYGVHGGH